MHGANQRICLPFLSPLRHLLAYLYDNAQIRYKALGRDDIHVKRKRRKKLCAHKKQRGEGRGR